MNQQDSTAALAGLVMRLLLPVTLSLWVTLAQAEILPPLQTLQRLHDAESFRQSKLAPTEVRQILQQIKATAFDTAKSWQNELRVRRISLQSVDGLIVQGSDLLCGATGNCQTWVFRKHRRGWMSLFLNQAPVAAGFGFAMVATHRIPDFLVAAHVSADEVDYASYSYDGQNYSVARCYRAKPDGQQAEEKPCK